MPVYYFHVRENGTLMRDAEGIDLPDMSAVRHRIGELVQSIFQEEYAADISADGEFQIEDASGRIVLIVPFRPALARAAAGR